MTVKVSSLIERQLPEFISTHYAAFSTFLEKYYESLEIQGQPLDILSNISSYYDINFYTKNILSEDTTLASSLSSSATEIELVDGSAFPQEYGYVKINDEICFYSSRNGNILEGVLRGVSGNTTLGDLYNNTNYVATTTAPHTSGAVVQNISNLFLFAILKSFESQYLASIPTKYLKKSVDKRTLIKNITDFYKAKGSEQSIKFVFNTLVSEDPQNEDVSVRRPSKQTTKASESDWISSFDIIIDLISGDPFTLIGKEITQESPFASFVVEDVKIFPGNIVKLIVDRSSVVGNFAYYGLTETRSQIESTDTSNFTVEVVSTRSWKLQDNKVYVGNEELLIDSRNVNQFKISSRSGSSTYPSGTKIYNTSPYSIDSVKFHVSAVVYELLPTNKQPYSSVGDKILESPSAKSSVDTVVYSELTGDYRWIGNQNRQRPTTSTLPLLQSQLDSTNADVSAIFEDETYFYICSSGYPSTNILDGTTVTGNLEDNKYLKLIRKSPISNTEIYKTDFYDVGVLLDGTLAYGTKSDSFVRYGPIQTVTITNKGSGYVDPPVVLVNGSSAKAISRLSGNVVGEIEILTSQTYQRTPSIVITSGRGGKVRPVITRGELTSLVIEDAGEYYVSPPTIQFTDFSGKGKFAEVETLISSNGRIIGFNIINPGFNYSATDTIATVVPVGKDATATVEIRKWYKNRYTETTSAEIDANGGALLNKKFSSKLTYGILSNPRRLRNKVGDNITSLLNEDLSGHSKILGFAYDGNPIYGPYGYEDPLDSQSSVVRLRTGYTINTSRSNGPSTAIYPLGSFVDDYTWTPTVESGKERLDRNNGRYCVTPEYPDGVYAYFVTVSAAGEPQYPYIIGENYYGVPVDSNYNSEISQTEIPRSSKFVDFSESLDNGKDFSATVSSIKPGTIRSVLVDSAQTDHKPGNKVFLDLNGTQGEDVKAEVDSVFGVDIEYLRSKKSAGIFTASSEVYLFDEFKFRQQNTGYESNIVGDVRFGTTIALENIQTEFSDVDLFDLVDPNTNTVVQVLNVVLDDNASFTANSQVILTNGQPGNEVAVGTILESTIRQNIVRIKVTSGDFNLGITDSSLFLRSSNLSDSTGIGIFSTRSLSENIEILISNYDLAIVKTNADHNLSVGDSINMSVNPDDGLTEKTYYVRKRLFQEVKLINQTLSARLFDTGIGRLTLLNGGLFRSTGTFNTTLGNASIEVVISEFDNFSKPSFVITNPGTGYVVGQRVKTQAPAGSTGEGLFINIDEVDGSGAIQSVSLSELGSGYQQNEVLEVVQTGGANASIQVSFEIYNSISDVTVLDKGSDFEEGKILFLDADLVTDPQDPSQLVFLTDFGVYMEPEFVFTARVDHAGLSEENTVLQVNNVENVSQDDLLLIDDEVVKVVTVDYAEELITVERGQEGTKVVEHYNGAKISFYNFEYRFTPGQFIDQIGNDPTLNPSVFSYDKETRILTLAWDNTGALPLPSPSTTESLGETSLIKDQSVEPKDVILDTVSEKIFRLEFAEDAPTNQFIVNPNIDIQNLYRYVFSTEHISMTGTFLDFSPSTNYNLVTLEKTVSDFTPGTAGAFVALKFGFGPALETNSYTETVTNNFSFYYYFIVAGGVDTSGSRLSIQNDPLSGEKNVRFVTNNKFLYSVNTEPQENGTGNIVYTTTGNNAIGLLNSISVTNSGFGFVDIPVVQGIECPIFREATATANVVGGSITSFNVTNIGSNYIDPVVIVEGGEKKGIFKPTVLNQTVISIAVLSSGSGYGNNPAVKIIEGSNDLYASSNNIGIPESITINNPGVLYSSDLSTVPSYTSTYTILVSGILGDEFSNGKTVSQFDSNGNLTFRAVVSQYKKGSNIVKLINLVGEISKKYPLNGATILSILYTNYKPELKSFYDKNGRYASRKGILSDSNSKITDSYYYQDYSYVIRSKTPIDLWRELIKDVVHPAGFELFGEVVVEAKPAKIITNESQKSTPIAILVNAGVKEAFTLNSSILLTERIVSCGNTNYQVGTGRVALLESGFGATDYADDVYLVPEFNGFIDNITNQRRGTKTFTIYDKKTDLPVSPYDETSFVFSLNNVIQEPKIAYTVNGSTVTFSEAPLGPRESEGQALVADSFIGKVFNYVEDSDSEKYFTKVRNIFQRGGIWLDAANQIHFNREFIVEETFGYITNKYPATVFDISKCKRDIGLIVDAYEHDLRFGGNSKTVLSGESYFNAANELNFVNNELEETREAYFYAAKLCAAAIRNWDVVFIDDPNTADPEFEVIVSASSDLITVPSTFGLVEGMYLSSGSQFPMDTRIIEIIDETNVRVSNNAFADITDNGSIIFEIPAGDVILPPGGSTEVEFEYNGVNILTDATLIVSNGITVTIESAVARLRQVRFSLSRINTGTFVDAANLIKVNRSYIIDETINYIITTFPTFTFPGLSEGSCRRDIGLVIDAVVFHLLYGGNNRIVDGAEKYFVANQLNYIANELTETIAAYNFAFELMKDAIENPGAPFETVNYDVQEDEENPLNVCAEVKSTIDSFAGIYSDTLTNGPNLIQRSFTNPQRSGEYTDILTYSNYNILDDADLLNSVEIDGVWFGAECATVVSALYTLRLSLDSVLVNGTNFVDISSPDYFNGENTLFELYKDEGGILKTETDEDLLVFLNGVLQRPSAYSIVRSENELETDRIQFSSPPIWDQSDAQLLLNQGTAVEYFHAFSIGPYDRRTVDTKRMASSAVFSIIDADTRSIVNPIFDDRYHLVFVNGVLQRNRIDYTINQTKIYFKEKLSYFEPDTGVPVSSTVDIISFRGDQSTNILTGFNFLPNEFTAVAELELYYDPLEFDFFEVIDSWYGGSYTNNTQPAVILANDKPVGTIISYKRIADDDPYPGIKFRLQLDSNPATVSSDEPIKFSRPYNSQPDLEFVFAIFINENLTFPGPETYVYGNIAIGDGFTVTVNETAIVVAADINLDFELNQDGERELQRGTNPWLFDDPKKNTERRTLNRLTSKLLEGDEIKIDGEKNFRKVLGVPDKLITTQYNRGYHNSDRHYGSIIVSPSEEVPPGLGLDIIPVLDSEGRISRVITGKDNLLEALTGEQRNIGAGYRNNVYVDFVPANGEGGGAYAKVDLWGGVVVGVTIINAGFGYTQPPIPVITRGFTINKSNRKASPSFNRIVNVDFNVNNLKIVGKQITIVDPFGPNNVNIFVDLGESAQIVSQDISLFLEGDLELENLQPGSIQEPITLFIPDSIVPITPVTTNESLVTRFADSLATAESPLVLAPSSPGSRTTLFTDSFAGDFFGPFNPESFEQTQTIIDIDFLAGSTVLFVTNTAGFPIEGELQVGGEVVSYNGLLPDRFFITARELRGTTSPAIHPVGTAVFLYLENQNINGVIREDIHTEIPEVFVPITASTEVNSIIVPNLDVTQPEVQNDSQLSYFIEDELQIVSIENASVDLNLVIQNTVKSVSPPEQEGETRVNIVVDTFAEGGLDLSTTQTPIFKFYESTADAEAFALFDIEESNVTLFYEFDAAITPAEPESTSIIIDIDTVDPVTETVLSVSLETIIVELTNVIPGGGEVATVAAAVVEPVTKFIDVDDNLVTIDVIDSVSELISIVEEPATPTPELEESVLDISAITIQSEIEILTSEIRGVTLITGPEIEAQEITKFPEDVVTLDNDNLDLDSVSEVTSGVDPVSAEVTVDSIDSSITVQIDQGSTDDFIETINTDEIGLN